jgi:hypothetical protein
MFLILFSHLHQVLFVSVFHTEMFYEFITSSVRAVSPNHPDNLRLTKRNTERIMQLSSATCYCLLLGPNVLFSSFLNLH